MKKRNSVFSFPKWWLLLAAIGIVVISIGIYLQKRPGVLGVIEVETSAAEGLEYEIWQEIGDSCWVVVIVDEIPSKIQLMAIAFLVWETTKTPNIFLYLPEMKTSGAAYGVAKFIPQGLKEFTIKATALKETKWEIEPARAG